MDFFHILQWIRLSIAFFTIKILIIIIFVICACFFLPFFISGQSPSFVVMILTKVVKIAFWLVKSYDFRSQNMLYVLNRLKKSKMGEIRLKSGEIVKIGWNRAKSRFQDRFYDCNKMHALKQNVTPMVQLSGAYWLWKCTVTPRVLHSSIFSHKRWKKSSVFSVQSSLFLFHRTNP